MKYLIVAMMMMLISCNQSNNEIDKREKEVADSVARFYQNKISKDSIARLQAPSKNIITDSALSTTEKIEKQLLGKRIFGVQFIWDGYGKAIVSKEDNVIKISGTQNSKDKSEYARIDGTISIINERKLEFQGSIQIFTKECCGVIDQTGTFTFLKKGKRKYWRLQEFGRLCVPYTCAYYLDIFE